MNRKLIMLSIATAGILLTGCGGGGGGSTTAPNQVISGNVVDGPIKDSRVTVNCSGGNYGPVITDASGAFTISNIGSNINLETCTINAVGGNDGINDFTGLTLKAPYKLAGTKTGINVTPITTLVANHDGDIEEAKTAISGFLNVDMDKLKENPNKDGNIALLRKAMMLTKIAQKQGKFLDVDGQKNQNNPISGDIDDLISGLDTELKDTIEAIKDSNLDSIAKIEKKVSQRNVFNALKDAYKLNSFETNQKENLMYLASKIVEANKKDNKYQVVSKHHIRKALTDAGLTPKFADDNYTTLHDDIKNELVKSQADFKTLIDGKTIAISDIKDFVLFDANTYEQIVGNDQEKRRNYYAYSNKSNISNTLSLIDKNSFTEQNDSINEYAGRGLAKIGLTDAAINHIKDNVIIPDNKYKALNWLGRDLSSYGYTQKASESLIKAFNQFKELSKGDINTLLITASYLKNLGETKTFNEALEYAINQAKKGNFFDIFNTAATLEKYAVDAYLKNNDIDAARSYLSNAIDLNNESTFAFFKASGLYTSGITAQFFGVNEKATSAIAKAKETSSKTAYNHAYNSLTTNDINTDITAFNSLSNTEQKDSLLNGFASSLVANDKLDTLISYYDDTNIFAKKSDVAKQLSVAFVTSHYITISPALGIELLSNKANKIKYLDKMYDLMTNTWNIQEDTEVSSIYATWGEKDNVKTGYLALAYEYSKENNTQKVQQIITKAIEKINALSDATSFQRGFVNIVKASKDLNVDISSKLSDMIKKVKNFALNTSKKDSIEGLITSAKLLTQYNKAVAIEILDHAKTLVPKAVSGSDTINKDVKEIVEFLIGKGAFSSFNDSLAYAYYLAGETDTTKSLINEAITNINGLGTLNVNYSELISRVVVAYASINEMKKAKEYLAKIGTTKEKEEAAIEAAIGLYEYDAFVSNVASVDSDGDTNPDFFAPNATEAEIKASGLKLDDDIDQDGIADISDKLPYDNI